MSLKANVHFNQKIYIVTFKTFLQHDKILYPVSNPRNMQIKIPFEKRLCAEFRSCCVKIRHTTALQHCDSLTITSCAALQVMAVLVVRVQVSWDVTRCFWRVASYVWKYRGAFMVIR